MRPDPEYPDASRTTVFAEAIEFQDYVCDRLAREAIILQNFASKKYQYTRGENLQGWEIKLDLTCLKTKRLSIEVAEKSRKDMPNWTPSGIFRGDSWIYIQGNYERLWIFGTKQLQRYFQQRKPETHESFGTVRKFYLDFDTACTVALRVLDGDGPEPEPEAPTHATRGPVVAPDVNEIFR
jgi:hypothetical protein